LIEIENSVDEYDRLGGWIDKDSCIDKNGPQHKQVVVFFWFAN